MKVVILAGGYGSRISEFTHKVPKPMINIGKYPIIWHIMKIYSFYGFKEFIICLGYKSGVIKNFFVNYNEKINSYLVDTKTGKKISSKPKIENWKIHLVETGQDTMTGGRIKRIKHLINEDHFCMTYGDGLANINIDKLVRFHKNSNSLATLTAVRPPERFGIVKLDRKSNVVGFSEIILDSYSFLEFSFCTMNQDITHKLMRLRDVIKMTSLTRKTI